MSVNFTLLHHLEWWFFGGLPVIKTRQDQFCIMRHHLTMDCSFFIFFVFKTNNRFLEPTRFSNLVQILWKINCANSSLLILATVTLWNNLPSDVVLSPSVNWFRTRVLAIRLNTINHWVPQIHVLTCTFAYIVHQLVLSRYAHVLHLFFITVSQFHRQFPFPLMFLTSVRAFSSFFVTPTPYPMHDDAHCWVMCFADASHLPEN